MIGSINSYKKYITVYKTNNSGLFIKFTNQPNTSNYISYIDYKNNNKAYKFNGKFAEQTYYRDWWHLPYDSLSIDKIEQEIDTPVALIGYKLIDETFESDKIPAYISATETEQFYNEDTDRVEWKKYDSIRTLYTEEFSKATKEWVEIPFEIETITEVNIDNVSSIKDMTITVCGDNSIYSSNKAFTTQLSEIVTYSELEHLLVPEFLLHERPCSLTREQSYKIIKQYIKTNINRSVAYLQSDYDFCLTVNKIIPLTDPYDLEIKKDNGKSYSSPKFKKILTKDFTIFDLAPKAYNSYPVVTPFKGNNLQDLYDNITVYLTDLIKVINQPMIECPHCKSKGYIVI